MRHADRTLLLRTTAAHRGRRLDAALAEWLPAALGRPVSKAALRRLIMAGAIRVGGRPSRQPGRPLSPGLQLEARIDLARLAPSTPAGDRTFTLRDADVLYEDRFLIAVNKPPGLPTHPTADPSRPHLWGALRRRLMDQGGAYLGVHQRLDLDTSGVVLFTKDPAANAGLTALFARHAMLKTYHALTGRPRSLPPPAWRVEDRLGPTGTGRGPRVARVASGGVRAETAFTRLEILPRALLVEARPLTGRKHQIRVHLAEAGLAILGDASYGSGPTPQVPRTMLHALRLAFPHPITGSELAIESPYPDDFRAVLERLRAEVSAVGRPARERPR